MSGVGGEPYKVIPAFILIVTHSSIIIWRIVHAKIFKPQQDFDFVISFFCICWSIYYVNRPGDTYLTIIFIVYSFVFVRIASDIRWLIGFKNKLFLKSVLFLYIFSYFSFYTIQLQTYYERMNVRHIKADKMRDADTFNTIKLSAIELSNEIPKNAGYITPFSFFVRSISGVKNNLSTHDPFSVLYTEKSLNAFLSNPLPKIIFMPRLDKLFHPESVPKEYQNFLDIVNLKLQSRGYVLLNTINIWFIYSAE
jgi:hypothetical protein